ncbi:hypothetical protein, partial [Aeromonas allosaccharophila]|uniref:hypothetical protein n=1 Tax=Aeromonas allosaccharophila TaxID=656 RepID=UPI0019599C0F
QVLKGWVSMMVDLKVMAYVKISLSTRNWDCAFFMVEPAPVPMFYNPRGWGGRRLPHLPRIRVVFARLLR